MDVFQHVFTEICLPVFVLIGIGWGIDRVHRVNLDSLVKLNLYVFVPAFIFVQLVESGIPGGMALRAFLFTLTMIGILFLLSNALARGLRWKDGERKACSLAAMFQNAGNFGIPLMALAYPGLGPQLEVFVIAAVNISTFTVGVLIASSGSHTSWRRFLPMLRQVSVWAIISAFAVRHFEIPVAEMKSLWVPLTYLKDALVAVALTTLGVQLSQNRHARPAISWLSSTLGLRLLAAPLIALGMVRVFGFHGEAAAIMVLSTAFPTAVNTALIAHEFRANSALAASAVFYSTLLSLFTVTLITGLLRSGVLP